MTSETLHEKREQLSEDLIDRHRAVASLTEELDAVDWYDQRAAATHDEELRAILLHNRDEEMEHAAMVLEWLRRRHPVFDKQLRTYLFREGGIVETERNAGHIDDAHVATGNDGGDGSLDIGSLRED